MLHKTFNNREFLGSNPFDSKYLLSPIYTYYQYSTTKTTTYYQYITNIL